MPAEKYVVIAAADKDFDFPKWWSDPAWSRANSLEVAQFRPESSAHRPKTQARLVHSETGLHGIFRVNDRYVRAVRTEFQGDVWKDSCVEFFVQPKADAGYFNFEMNCGGTLLSSYITDPKRLPGGALKESVRLSPELGRTIIIHSTLPKRIDPEITEPITWELCFYIPFTVFEQFVGPLGKISGQQWRGNFYKCAEEVSNRHWAAWSPVDELNFHLPRCFGLLQLT